MRITRIELYRASIGMLVPLKVAIGLAEVSQSLFVGIHTDSGIVGIGEGNVFAPVVGETADSIWAAAPLVAQALIGTDPHDIETRAKQMKRMLPYNSTLRSAFEIALWDVLGKAANLPLFALLGGRQQAVATDNTAGMDVPEVMAERALGFKTRGFAAVKIKLGDDVKNRSGAHGGDPRGGRPGHADPHRRQSGVEPNLGARHARGVGAISSGPGRAALAQAGHRRHGHAPARDAYSDHGRRVAVRRTRRTAAGRGGGLRLFQHQAGQGGGIWTALKINAIAETAGLPCMVGCMTESGIGLSAAVHLVSARDNIIFADLDSADMLDADPVLGGFVYEPGGKLTPKTLPGLGVEIDPAFLAGLETRVIE